MSFDKIGPIISAAMLVHNFIIDEKETNADAVVLNWRDLYPCHRRMAAGDCASVLDCGNPVGAVGRPAAIELMERQRGINVRQKMKLRLRRHGMVRMTASTPQINCFGQVYFV